MQWLRQTLKDVVYLVESSCSSDRARTIPRAFPVIGRFRWSSGRYLLMWLMTSCWRLLVVWRHKSKSFWNPGTQVCIQLRFRPSIVKFVCNWNRLEKFALRVIIFMRGYFMQWLRQVLKDDISGHERAFLRTTFFVLESVVTAVTDVCPNWDILDFEGVLELAKILFNASMWLFDICTSDCSSSARRS